MCVWKPEDNFTNVPQMPPTSFGGKVFHKTCLCFYSAVFASMPV